MHAFAVILGIHPAITAGGVGLQRRQRVDGCADTLDAAVIVIVGTRKNAIFRRFRCHVEVAHHDVILGQWRIADVKLRGTCERPALGYKGIDAPVQVRELPAAFVDGDMIEMHRIDAACAGWRLNNGLGRATLEIDLGDRSAARKKQGSGR